MPHELRLNSWKEIAGYLGRDVRTALRWEKERGLPVRSIPGGKRRRVFAYQSELDGWLDGSRGALQIAHATASVSVCDVPAGQLDDQI
jgi:hypothetical protein